jgi:hypothetical protein
MSDYWDRRDDDRRRDQELARRDRTEADAEAWQAPRRGDTARAINAIAGPEAALSYLDGISREPVSGEPGPGSWPDHQFPEDVWEFRSNVRQLEAQGITLLRCGIDGDRVRFEAYGGREPGEWFIGSCSLPVGLVRDYVAQVSLDGPGAYDGFVIAEFRRAGG